MPSACRRVVMLVVVVAGLDVVAPVRALLLAGAALLVTGPGLRLRSAPERL